MKRTLLSAIAAAALGATMANATVILTDSGDTLQGYFTPGQNAVGQSLTTPAGGPWSSILFSFYSANIDPVTLGPEVAQGGLYLLTQAYSGTPGALSNATPGFLASTSTIVNGEWVFAPSVTLQPNTQYFFFENSTDPAAIATTATFAGGTAYRADPFFNGGIYTTVSNEAIFLLQGTGTATPEPASCLLTGIGLFGVVAVFRRCRGAL
jgi:hypothetical protein